MSLRMGVVLTKTYNEFKNVQLQGVWWNVLDAQEQVVSTQVDKTPHSHRPQVIPPVLHNGDIGQVW